MGERHVAGEGRQLHGRLRPQRSPRSLVVALFLGIVLLLAVPVDAYADDHHLAFMTDYHNSGDSLTTVLRQMPADTEYVSIVGDLVGNMDDMWPEYKSSSILDLVQQALPTLTAKDVSIVWASHDRNVIDDAGIVKCLGGNTSGLIYTVTESDGSIACYVYGIGHYDMSEGEEQSTQAAAAFKAWVKGTDPCIPLIVVCHVPIHAARGDNYGASYWSEALNYAATGVEGLTATGTTAKIVRNVVFMHGHNHTNDENEYLYLPGSTMKVAVDVPSDKREKRGPKPDKGGEGERRKQSEGFDPTKDPGEGGSGPKWNGEGTDATIYYTSLTAGYLKIRGTATLVSVTDDALTLTKYGPQGTQSLGKDPKTLGDAPKSTSLTQFMRTQKQVDDSLAISFQNVSGSPVSGGVVGVFDEKGTLLTTLVAAPTLTLGTSDPKLEASLPAPGETVTFELRELSAPVGYGRSSETFKVTVTATEAEELVDHTYVHTITYALSPVGADEIIFHHSLSSSPSPASSSFPSQGSSQSSWCDSYAPSSYAGTSTSSSTTANRLAGSDRYDTMREVILAAFSSSDWAVLATGDSYADALDASALAGAHDAPVILTTPQNLSSQARDLLTRLGVQHVVILGGTAAVSAAVEDEVGSMGIDCERIWGQNRQETAVRALEATRAAGSVSDTVCIVSGMGFADALSIGPWCNAQATPLVLTRADGTLDAEAVAAITADARVKRIIFVGGTGVVSDAVRDQLGDGYAYTRLGGANRYETSAAVARWAQGQGMGFKRMAVATGRTFPDALAAAVLLGRQHGMLLLMDDANDATFALAREHRGECEGLTVLGGTAAVSPSLVEALQR